MSELVVEFLCARIADDEEAARDAAGWQPSGRERSCGRWQRDGLNSVVDDDQRLVVYGDGPSPDDSEAAHITRWDPARVLAECEAKRRVVARAEWCAEWIDGTREFDNPKLLKASVLRDLLGPLAAVYADHPDWREEWRP